MANILVPFDFSANAITALDQAIMLANKKSLSVEVLHITNAEVVRDYPQAWKDDPGYRTIEAIQQHLDEVILQRKTILGVDGSQDISGQVKESAMINGGLINHMLINKSDLIVMGTHGATNAVGRFWGSNTSTMINHALFPILAVPRNWKAIAFNELIAAVSLKDVEKSIQEVTTWSTLLKTSAEFVCISSVPALEQDTLNKILTAHPEIKAHLVPKQNDLPLWRNLVQFTNSYTSAILLMFVHERTVLEKLFNYSITSRVAEGIHIPLLAIPTAHK